MDPLIKNKKTSSNCDNILMANFSETNQKLNDYFKNSLQTLNTIEKLNENATHFSYDLKKGTKYNQTIKLNVGGKIFFISKEKLINCRSDMLKNMLKKLGDFEDELFFDRSWGVFPYILNLINYGNINLEKINDDCYLDDFFREALYYGLSKQVVDILGSDVTRGLPEFSNVEITRAYEGGNNNLESIKDKNLITGIISDQGGEIIFTLKNSYNIKEIDIGGYTGSGWSNVEGYGHGAKIQGKTESNQWINLGSIPINYGQTIKRVKLISQNERISQLKFSHTSWIGIGHLSMITPSNMYNSNIYFKKLCDSLK